MKEGPVLIFNIQQVKKNLMKKKKKKKKTEQAHPKQREPFSLTTPSVLFPLIAKDMRPRPTPTV